MITNIITKEVNKIITDIYQTPQATDNTEQNKENAEQKIFNLDEKKIATLCQLIKKGFLPSANVQDLIYPENCKSAVSKALKKLQDLGLLEKQDFIMGSLGKQDSLYKITRKGLNLLINSGFLEENESFKLHQKNISIGNYQHKKAILDYWASLEKQCLNTSNIRLDTFYPEWSNMLTGKKVMMRSFERNQTTEENQTPTQNQTINPDATFALEDTSTGQKHLYFLEADLGTIPITSEGKKDIETRIYKYQVMFTEMAFKRALPEFKNFMGARVIFLFNRESRLKDTIEKAEIHHGLKDAFLFTVTFR